MCNWIALKNCKNIVLISRSGMKSSGAQSFVDELEGLGVRLKVYACDVSNAEELNLTLKTCFREMPPIRGVIQSAMVIRVSGAGLHLSIIFSLTKKGLQYQQYDIDGLPRCPPSQSPGYLEPAQGAFTCQPRLLYPSLLMRRYHRQ